MTREDAFKEFKGYEGIRNEFFAYLDSKIPFKEGTNSYDFEKAEKLNPEEIYELFFKLDYQARKVRGVGIELLNEFIPEEK
ncbi:MAG: hypothetical protein OIF32_00850 [Campylobacterales bacterium]|nr:hypothetical protein [Campylobacterales bacterium]